MSMEMSVTDAIKFLKDNRILVPSGNLWILREPPKQETEKQINLNNIRQLSMNLARQLYFDLSMLCGEHNLDTKKAYHIETFTKSVLALLGINYEFKYPYEKVSTVNGSREPEEKMIINMEKMQKMGTGPANEEARALLENQSMVSMVAHALEKNPLVHAIAGGERVECTAVVLLKNSNASEKQIDWIVNHENVYCAYLKKGENYNTDINAGIVWMYKEGVGLKKQSIYNFLQVDENREKFVVPISK